jgi:PAS domain S-box-containing protein
MKERNTHHKNIRSGGLNPVFESLRIVIPYTVLGCLWIFFSDALLNLASDAHGMVVISNIKGWAYVLVTAGLIWALVHSRIRQVKANEEMLADSEARFRLLVESAPDAVFVHTDDRFVYVNKKTLDLLGASSEGDLLGRSIADVMPDEQRDARMAKIHRSQEEGKPRSANEEVIQRLDGSLAEVETSAVPIRYKGRDGTLVFMRDITERRRFEKSRRRLELQVRQAHRLESVGTLAGGIAHEINNPISGIINYAHLIADHPAADDVLLEYSGEIVCLGHRVAGTVKNLLSFSRPEQRTHVPAAVSDIIGETVSLIRSVLQHDQIDLQMNVAENLPDISCCAQQIQQLLMNLITNARDALNARYPCFDENKKLIIAASAFERGGAAWVRIVVEDSGSGIPEDLLPRVFDPFYTTSMRSEHAGLGLSISHGIVRDHHGEIYFETQPQHFTRAVVELPAEKGALV